MQADWKEPTLEVVDVGESAAGIRVDVAATAATVAVASAASEEAMDVGVLFSEDVLTVMLVPLPLAALLLLLLA